MDLGTTTANTYTGKKGLPAYSYQQKVVEGPKPII
jgi:hypothetical protein